MTDGLKDEHREAIIAAIAANDRVERAVLFGSRATGTNTVSSDVDIALFGDRLTLTDQARLAAVLDKFPMAQSVDLLLYDSIQDWTLREHIRRQGIEWYALPPRDESHDPASASGSEWPVVKLGEVSSDEPGSIAVGPFGSRMKSDVYTPSGVPVIRGTNISKDRAWRNEWVYVSDGFADGLPNCNVREGDLVFPHRGSIGEVAIIPGDRARYMLSTSLMKFRPDPEKISPLFLFYYFRSDTGRAEIMRFSSQVGTPGIGQPLTSLRQFRVPMPSREEQERITGILSSIDDKIELNRRMNATLAAMARALFKSWFVDFDPVRAKGDGRDPGLAQEFLELFPESFDNEGRPQGWSAKPLDEVAEFLNGLAMQKFPASEISDSLPVIKISELRSGITPRTGRASRDIPSKYVVRDGDFLFSWSGSLLARFWTGGEGALNQHLFKVMSNRYPMWFCSHWIYHHLEEFQAIAASKATTMGHIQRGHLNQATATCPPDGVLGKLGCTMDPLVNRTIKNELESRALVEIRDLLLPKLITGEIRVLSTVRKLEAAT